MPNTQDGKLQLLLVEDNASEALLLREHLSESSLAFEMLHVQTLAEGIAVLQSGQRFDAVLLDLSLPDSSGMETIRQLLAGVAPADGSTGPSIPVVVMTGLDDQTVGLAALQEGAQDYLVKGRARPDDIARSLRYSILRVQMDVERQRLMAQLTQARDELEIRVAERTADLATTIEVLQGEVVARTQAEGDLRLAETRYRTLVEQLPALVYTARPEEGGDATYVSPGARRLLGYDAKAWAASGFRWSIVHPDDVGHVRDAWNAANKTGAVFHEEYRIKTAPGKIRWVHDEAMLILTGSAPYRQGIAVDITERVMADLELQRVNRALRVMSECDKGMSKARDEQSALDGLCQNLTMHGGYTAAAVYVGVNDARKSIRCISKANITDEEFATFKLSWGGGPRGMGPTGRTLRTGRAAIARDITTGRETSPWRKIAMQAGIKSCISMPLKIDGELFGAVTIYSSDADAFDRQEVRLMTELAEDVSFSLSAIRARRERQQAQDELMVQTIKAQQRTDSTNELLELFTRTETRQAYLDSVVGLLSSWSGCRCVGVRLLDSHRGIPYGSYQGFTKKFWQHESFLSLDKDDCICPRVMRQTCGKFDKAAMTPRGAFICNDLAAFTASLPAGAMSCFRGGCIEAGFRSLAVISISYGRQLVGAIHLADRRPNRLSSEVVEFLEIMAPLIGEAIHRFAVEEALRVSEEYFRSLYESSEDCISQMGTSGEYLSMNEVGCEAYGLAGKDLRALKCCPNIATNREGFDLAMNLAGRGQVAAVQYKSIGAHGREIWWDAKLTPIRDADGEVTSILQTARDVTDRRRMEEEILQISTQERLRIGQDLHDSLGQLLTGVSFLSRVLHKNLETQKSPQANDAGQIATLLTQAINQTRMLARGLVPLAPTAEGLMEALHDLSMYVESAFSIPCIFSCLKPVFFHDDQTATHLYRIAQEAVSNAAKHGKPTRIRIQLQQSGVKVVLRVMDDGIGIPALDKPTSGMGFRTMKYRADLIGAKLYIRKIGKKGTAVVCTLASRSDAPAQVPVQA